MPVCGMCNMLHGSAVHNIFRISNKSSHEKLSKMHAANGETAKKSQEMAIPTKFDCTVVLYGITNLVWDYKSGCTKSTRLKERETS